MGRTPTITPRVLELLESHGACATFFCIGERVLRYPDLAQEIVRRGHVIENHSQRHRHNFSLLGPGGMNSEVSQAQESIFRVTGSNPQFFRAPAGLRNPFLDPVLARLKLRLASWTRRGFDTVSADADAVLRRLINALQAGDILLLHDGNAARTRRGQAGDSGGAAAPSRCPDSSGIEAGHVARRAAAAVKPMQPLLLADFTATSCIGTGVAPTLASLLAQRSGLTYCDFETVKIDTHIGEVAGRRCTAAAGAAADIRLPQ